MEKESILLKDLQDLLKNKSKYKFQEAKGHQGVPEGYDGNQDEYNEYFIFYKHLGLPENIFMKETYHTDSYGNGDFLAEIQFVKGKEKVIKVFEPI